MTVETFPLPDLKGSEALVAISCATVCGSDLHTYFGRRNSPSPSVLGHEMVGHIAAIGPRGVTAYRGHPLKAGDRVTWSMVWSCGRCYFCALGLRAKCEHLLKFGHETLSPGRELLGGFARHCLLPEGTAIFRVPPEVGDLAAAPANCATATVASVFRESGPCAGQSVVIYGTGMLGLTACAMAAANGAAHIIAIEKAPGRADLARPFGATSVIDGSLTPTAIREAVFALTDNRGADALWEFTGIPEVIETGFHLLRFGGRYIIAGAVFPARPVQFPADQLVRRLLRISGVYNYNPEDLKAALAFLAANAARFPFDSLVGRTFPLCEAQQAFQFAETAKPLRVAVLPPHTARTSTEL